MLNKPGVASHLMTWFCSYRDVDPWHLFEFTQISIREEYVGSIQLQKTGCKGKDCKICNVGNICAIGKKSVSWVG